MIFKTFSDRLGVLLVKDGRKNWLAMSAIFFFILSPVLLMAIFSYWKTRQDLTSFALSQRQAIAYLAATTLKEKLDRLVDISVSLASRVRFRQLVSESKWDEAVQILIKTVEVAKNEPGAQRVAGKQECKDDASARGITNSSRPRWICRSLRCLCTRPGRFHSGRHRTSFRFIDRECHS